MIIVHLSSTGASKSACLTALKSLTRKGKQLLSAIFFVCVSEVVMLDMKGHMVVLGTALGTLMVPGYWSLQMG